MNTRPIRAISRGFQPQKIDLPDYCRPGELNRIEFAEEFIYGKYARREFL